MIWPRISWALTPRAKRKISLTLGLIAILLLVVSSNWFWRTLYPIEYEAQIRTEAQANHLDPLLVAALIRVESKFDEDNTSHVGAVGLMQLMPETAGWVAEQSGIAYGGTEALSDPETNVKLGSWYLSYLSKQFKGNWVAVVAAYNAGPNRVSKWMEDGVWDGQLETTDRIPVGETRHYVQRVFYFYDKYEKIYTE